METDPNLAMALNSSFPTPSISHLLPRLPGGFALAPPPPSMGLPAAEAPPVDDEGIMAALAGPCGPAPCSPHPFNDGDELIIVEPSKDPPPVGPFAPLRRLAFRPSPVPDAVRIIGGGAREGPSAPPAPPLETASPSAGEPRGIVMPRGGGIWFEGAPFAKPPC